MSLRRLFGGVIAVLLLLGACGGSDDSSTENLRIGWQTPWATQGQVVQSLKHTDILERNSLTGDFVGFSFGGPLNAAALAGEVDVLFTADQPAANLIARDGEYSIVARLMYNRVGIYAPPDSDIIEVADLEGKNLAMPFGAAAQRDALAAIQAAGLDPQSDVELINLDILEHGPVIRGGSSASWGNIDALSGFDPSMAIFEAEGIARSVHVGQVVSVVMASNAMIEQQPDTIRRFLKSYMEAWAYFNQNPEDANAWFMEESGLSFEGFAPLDLAASVEPNATTDELRFTFSDADMAVMQEAADFLADNDMVPVRVTMADHVNLDLLGDVSEIDIDGVKVTD